MLNRQEVTGMPKEAIKDLVDRIIADGVITRAEQRLLNNAILKDGQIDPAEKEQIERLFDMIYRGEIRAVP